MSAPQYPSHVPCPECGEYKKPIGANMCWDCKDKEMADLLVAKLKKEVTE